MDRVASLGFIEAGRAMTEQAHDAERQASTREGGDMKRDDGHDDDE